MTPPSLFFFPHPQFLNSGGKISIIWSDAGLWRSHKCTKKWQRTALPSPIIVDYLNLCGASYLVISSTSFKLMEAYLSSKPYWSLHTKRDTCWVCVQARTVMRCKWELQAAQMNLCSASLRLYHMLTEVKKKKKGEKHHGTNSWSEQRRHWKPVRWPCFAFSPSSLICRLFKSSKSKQKKQRKKNSNTGMKEHRLKRLSNTSVEQSAKDECLD